MEITCIQNPRNVSFRGHDFLHLTTEVVPKIFQNLTVVAHLVVSCRLGFVPAETGYFIIFLFTAISCKLSSIW